MAIARCRPDSSGFVTVPPGSSLFLLFILSLLKHNYRLQYSKDGRGHMGYLWVLSGAKPVADSLLNKFTHFMCSTSLLGPTENTKLKRQSFYFFNSFCASSRVFGHLRSRKHDSNTFIDKSNPSEDEWNTQLVPVWVPWGESSSKVAE